MKASINLLTLVSITCAASSALAALPEPSEEAKAAAAVASARAAWSAKVASYQLCQSMDRVAAAYLERARAEGKAVTPVPTPPCTDPGAFSETPPAPKPIEAAGAHSPPPTAATPPSTTQPAAAAGPGADAGAPKP